MRALATIEGGTVVTVAPITHTPPSATSHAVELPASTKRRLGLDEARSWIICSDLNTFAWPGFDLRPARRGEDSPEFGVLPTKILAQVRDSVVAAARARVTRTTPR